MPSLKGKTAIVTGGAKGIGAAIVRRFVAEGATGVVVLDYDEELAKATAQSIGGNVHVVKCDVSDSKSVEAGVAKAVEILGRIDILINNAGITRDAIFHKMTDEQWQQVININLGGTYNCCRFVVPLMREQKYGKIVNISSVSARGNAGQANYSASKAAVEGLTKTLCKELAGKNITVNAIAPANIATDILDTIPDHLKALTMMISPIHRYGTTDELASVALFLASDDSSYINGVVLNVDGGLCT